MDPNTINIIIASVVSLLGALGGKEIVKYIITSRKEKNDYEQKKDEKLEDYLANAMKSLQERFDEQNHEMGELLKRIEKLIRENSELKVQLGIMNEKLRQFYEKYGIGSRGKN